MIFQASREEEGDVEAGRIFFFINFSKSAFVLRVGRIFTSLLKECVEGMSTLMDILLFGFNGRVGAGA